jgi:hypothetical protein
LDQKKIKINENFIFENVQVQTPSIFEKMVFQKIAFFKEFCLQMKKFLPIKCVLSLHYTYKKMAYLNSEKRPRYAPDAIKFKKNSDDIDSDDIDSDDIDSGDIDNYDADIDKYQCHHLNVF